ncbi:MAG: DUF2148 domain-containing protein [Rikenellaceae bacterium]
MILNQREDRDSHVINVARHMMNAARTAPKGKGIDVIEIALVEGIEDLKALSVKMVEIAEATGMKFFLRDAENICQGQCVILIGTRKELMGLNCAHCGYATCASKPMDVPCALNSIDVGIAVGSACATASDMRVDTRVMFSAGLAAQQLGWLGDGVEQVMAIAVSSSSKSPFFDRKPKK